jgi:hypothetical protein
MVNLQQALCSTPRNQLADFDVVHVFVGMY